jgi:DNA-binding transcriptional LysR family regulator
MEDELVLITPQQFETDRVSRNQFLASCLLMREQGSGTRRVVEAALEKAGFKLRSFKQVIDLDSTEAIKSAVEAGFGIGFVSRWAISKELELGTLRVAQVTDLKIMRKFSLVTRTGPEPHGPAGALREFALGRARFLSATRQKPLATTDSSR